MTQPVHLPAGGTRVQFGSRLGFLLATAGSAIGLGNIWRFPFIAGEHGGGAFLLPYILVLGAIGIPVMIVELAVGRATGKGVIGTFAEAGRKYRWVGAGIAIASLFLVANYLVVTGWALGYLVYSVADSRPSFGEFTSGLNSLIFFATALLITVVVVRLGVNKGIEMSSKVLVPALLALLVGMAAYAMTLDGLGDALDFYLGPRPSELLNVGTWAAAVGQVFFSVGVGMGVLITYGAYMSTRENVTKSATGIAIADTGVAILAGLVIFPIVFTFGSEPGSGPALAFDTLPIVFGQFNPTIGYLLATLFYLALTVAALTSAISLLETVSVATSDAFGAARNTAIWICSAAILLLGIPAALSYTGLEWTIAGRPVFDLIDGIEANFLLPLGVLLTVTVLSWGAPMLLRDGIMQIGRPERGVLMAVKWLAPVALVALLAAIGADLLIEGVDFGVTGG